MFIFYDKELYKVNKTGLLEEYEYPLDYPKGIKDASDFFYRCVKDQLKENMEIHYVLRCFLFAFKTIYEKNGYYTEPEYEALFQYFCYFDKKFRMLHKIKMDEN